MKKYKRIFTIVIDSFGAGEMPDAAQYGDEGTDTMGHISQNVDEFTIPNLQKLGIANLHPLKQVAAVERPMGYYTFLKEVPTKDGIKKLAERDFGNDKYQIIGDMVYVAFATKASDSRLTNNVIEQKLGVSATTRNYNTVKKLVELTI